MWGCERSCTRMCVCRCARMFVRVYACMRARMYVCVCIHACMHACIGVCVHVCVGVFMYACMHVCVWVRVCCVSMCLYVHTRTNVNTSYWDQMNRVLARRGQDNIEIWALGTGTSMHIRTRQRHRPCSLRGTHASTCQPASSSLCPPLFLRPLSHLTTWPNIQILELPFGETVDYRNFTVGVPYNDIINPQQLVEYLHQELMNRYPALRDALHAVCLFAFCLNFRVEGQLGCWV